MSRTVPHKPRHSFAVRTPMVQPGQRIGLLGGSFNPAHDGHRLISDIAMKRLGLDRVWWIVSPGNPLKSHADLAPLDARMHRARVVAGSPRIEITAFEAALGSPYTIDTLVFLRRRYPAVQFVWLMGADNLVQMPRWRQWRRIFELMPVAVVDRPGWHLAALSSPAARAFAGGRVHADRVPSIFRATRRWVFLSGPLSTLSSSVIRGQGGSQGHSHGASQ